ncbi:MAG: double-strand break repair protein AddB [Hyphococcus sp.]|nr:MAG: double-strand break repair protein AddB [Marinicaulis sp.]
MKQTPSLDGVFNVPPARIFSIAPGQPFLSDLACGLRSSLEKEKDFTLSDALIYLPTRRAVRALTEAFIKTTPNAQATLLPRIRAIGDMDEDEAVVFSGAPQDEIDLPPAISSVKRRLALARLVAARDRAFDGQERWAGALAAADELSKLLDSLYTEEISPDKLEKLVPENLAAHWQLSLKFLEIIVKSWPGHLQTLGLMDPSDRRVKLIDRQRQLWEKAPPQHPIIIAGTTGSTPAVARMMKVAASLPFGAVVLPGLDLNSDPQFWQSVDEPHPQSGLKQLLKELRAERSEVTPWPSRERSPQKADIFNRSDILSVALRPANASDSWRDWAVAINQDRKKLQDALQNFELVESPDEEREADTIAIKIRGAIEEPEKKVILVTPDRDLARRVSMKLRRWDITVDDSGGMPFANSPCGTYLRLIAQWLKNPSDAIAVMSILRHPLFAGGLSPATANRSINAADLALRGLQPAPGIDGLHNKIMAGNKDDALPVLTALLEAASLQATNNAPFQDRLTAHLTIAERLAASEKESGTDRLWRGEDGEEGAKNIAQLHEIASEITDDHSDDYADIFDQLIAKIVVRRHASAHPRIAILGPLEARLQNADTIILGGLNEGVWPRDAAIDPFLSRPMRRSLGLPSPEQRIGLAAHDFAQLASAPSVMITRSLRAGGKPSKPSRWVVRLKNILIGAKALPLIDRSADYEALCEKLDHIESVESINAPSPRPPIETRPKKFFVTRVEKLMRDPYAVYAREILRLKKHDRHNEPFDVRHVGNLFHKVLEDFGRADAPMSVDAGAKKLRALFDDYAPQYGLTEEHLPFWRDRVDAAFASLSAWDHDRRQMGRPVIIEEKGEWKFEIDGQDYTIAAKTDRIDQLHDGSTFIIDYKTGTPPPTDKQQKKFSPQLPLTGLIARNGGFKELNAVTVSGFDYVRVLNRTNKTKNTSGAEGEKAAAMIDEAAAGFIELMQYFNNPATPYPSQPRPLYMDEYGDYDHLARRRERSGNTASGDNGEGSE